MLIVEFLNPSDAVLDPAEQSVVGLVCCLIGVFFLANSIIFRKLKNVIASFFGVKKQSLIQIKDYTLNNLQVVFGFFFLAVGFLIQMYAHLGTIDLQAQSTMWILCGVLVMFAVIVYLAGRVYSRHTFKKYVRRFFQDHPEAFNKDINLTKEIGAFFGVVHTEEMTVEDYLQNVRKSLRIGGDQDHDDSQHGGGLAPEGGRRRRDLGAYQGRG